MCVFFSRNGDSGSKFLLLIPLVFLELWLWINTRSLIFWESLFKVSYTHWFFLREWEDSQMPLICSLLGLQPLQESNTITTIRPCWSELAIRSLLTMLGLFYSAQFYMYTRVCSTLAAFILIIILFVGILKFSKNIFFK